MSFPKTGPQWVFAAHYEEAQVRPMKFRYAMHNFTGGRPGLAKVFEQFEQSHLSAARITGIRHLFAFH